jgi:transcriptional regulator with XRE-family HTH domain
MGKGTPLPYLAAWRKRAYLSQSELATRAGINTQTVKNIEKARYAGAQRYSIQAIAQALGISVQELAEEEPPASRKDCTPLEEAVKPLVDYIVKLVVQRLQEAEE